MAITLVVTIIPLASAGAETKIVLRPEVEIATELIYLGQIAEIQTDDDNLRQKLEAVELGRPSSAGRLRTINLLHIKSRLALHQLDASQYTFVGSESLVRYKELTASPESILEGARAFYRSQLILDSSDAELQIEPKIPIRPLRIPNPEAKLKFVPLKGDLWKASLEVQALYNGIVTDRASLSFQLSACYPVVVATQDIPRRMVIKPEHLKLERRKIENLSHPPFTKLDDVIGKTADVAIPQGEVITASLLRKTYLVARESIVTMVARRGNLNVQTLGKALENGERGQLIRVMNLTSKKEVLGEVIGDKVVRIHF